MDANTVTLKRRNSHPDQHQRDANDAKQDEMILASVQHIANATEWGRRLEAALDGTGPGDPDALRDAIEHELSMAHAI